MTSRKRTIFLLVSVGVVILITYVLLTNKFTHYKKSEIKRFFRLLQNEMTSSKTPVTAVKDDVRTAVLLFVGIYSAPIHADRRNAVRETWMTQCKRSKKAACWFITDGKDTKGRPLQVSVKMRLENESRLQGDLLFAQSPGGVNFARRYLWMAQWASERYNFQYLLRVDDDYFICFERLLLELEFHRPKRAFRWGWLHCRRGKSFNNPDSSS